MRLLFFSDNFPPEVNAAASRVFERACYWAKQGHEVTFVTCAPNFPVGKIFPGYKNKWYQVEEINGIRVVRVKTFIAQNKGVFLRTLDFISYFFSSLIAACFLKKPDIVIATSPQFFAGLAGCVYAKFRKTPFVLEVSDLWPASVTAVGVMQRNVLIRFLEKFELYMYKSAKRIVALTTHIKNDLVKRNVPSDKIMTIINGVDIARYSPLEADILLIEKYDLKNKFVVAYIGTHGLAQKLENVIQAAKILRENKEIVFLFVGAGAERDGLVALARNESLGNVVFLPMQAKTNMPAIWSLCDIALVHLRNDPLFSGVLPSKIFEAMAMAKPILLVCPQGEASAFIEENAVGITIEPENPLLLAQTILKYQLERELLKKFSENSYRAAQQNTRENQADKFLTVLQTCLSENEVFATYKIEDKI